MSTPVTLSAPLPGADAPPAPKPKTLAEAAQQFEALMIGQMLKEARGDANGWLGSGEETGDGTLGAVAEEQFAQALAKSGGLGLSRQIVASMTRPHAVSDPQTTP